MKNKIILLLIAVVLFQTARSQDKKDSTSSNPVERKADTVKIGSIVIIQKDSSTGKHGSTTTTTTVNFGSGDNDKKKEPDNVEIDWFGFEIGINSFVDKSNYGTAEVNDFVRPGAGHPAATEDMFSLRTIKSVNVNIWPVLFRVNLINHVVNLKTGIGIVMNNYRYTKNITYVTEPDETYIKLSDLHLEKNKLFTEYLTIPVLLNLNTNPRHDSKSFHLSVGPTFGLLIKSRTKQISEEKGKHKKNDPFNLEKFRTGLRAEIGYGHIGFYGAYSFTPIHKYGLVQYPFSIGISLTP